VRAAASGNCVGCSRWRSRGFGRSVAVVTELPDKLGALTDPYSFEAPAGSEVPEMAVSLQRAERDLIESMFRCTVPLAPTSRGG
jgi:hypothetical protein